MKIAVITDDEKTVSQHFGRAKYYLVVTIEEGTIKSRELREKLGHDQFSQIGHEEHSHSNHEFSESTHEKHSQMAEAIADCAAVICGGMGMGAYESMHRLNILPIVTDINDIEMALRAYIEGKLVDHTERLH